jgi:hypothetical protein
VDKTLYCIRVLVAFYPLIVIYYTSGLNECLTSDAFNSASGEAASALTSQVLNIHLVREYNTTVYPILH